MVTSRILFTAKQKDELWERWKNGQSVLAISRALERRNKTGVQRIVALNGGIAPALGSHCEQPVSPARKITAAARDDRGTDKQSENRPAVVVARRFSVCSANGVA